jgi:hypothetical protein
MRWVMRKTVERRATRMQQMMDRLSVNALALVCLRNGDAYVEARSRCLLCNQGDECIRWLDTRNGPNSGPDFCPNLEIFSACSRLSSAQSGHVAARTG